MQVAHNFFVGDGQFLVHNCERIYEPNSKHGNTERSSSHGTVSTEPKNGQAALDRSVQVKNTSPRRVGVDYDNNEIVVLDQHRENRFHGHVPGWKALHPDMKNALIRAGLVTQKGDILPP